MSTWIVGDVHGHFEALERLARKIELESSDRLILVGDLVNGGGRSADVIRWCADRDAIVTLGNHDLHMLAVYAGARVPRPKDDFADALEAPDSDELMSWLAGCPLTYYLPDEETLVVHAGLVPQWSVGDAVRLGREVETALLEADPLHFFGEMYGNKPARWRAKLEGERRMRCIINALTRIRTVDDRGKMHFEFSGTHHKIPAGLMAWFDHPDRKSASTTVVFGHWSALGARKWSEHVISLDGGVRWGKELFAMRLEDRKFVGVSAE